MNSKNSPHIGNSISMRAAEVPVGVVGLGLMGTSIATCLLAAGHPVIGVETDRPKRLTARRRILAFLKEMKTEHRLQGDPQAVVGCLSVSKEYSALAKTRMVIESIIENLKAKRKVLREIERATSPSTIVGSNTSAIPISLLQRGLRRPGRMLGIHWAEPAHTTRFLEIICGQQTDLECAEWTLALARGWGKEPSLVRRDIRGFIANRCMYALLREAFHLVESGYASIERCGPVCSQ